MVILPLQTWGKQGYGPILARGGLGGYADGGAAESQVYEGGAMVKICLLVLLIAAPAAFAGDMTFANAKALADRDEDSLSGAQKQALVQAQAPVVQAALSSCLTVNGPKPFSFVVVVELDSTGSVRGTWRSDETKLAGCFQSVAAKATLNSPPRSPFYSSFEMSVSADGVSQ